MMSADAPNIERYHEEAPSPERQMFVPAAVAPAQLIMRERAARKDYVIVATTIPRRRKALPLPLFPDYAGASPPSILCVLAAPAA